MMKIRASADGGYHWYRVTFAREEDAVSFYDRKARTHVIDLMNDDVETIPEDWSTFYDRMYPTCHHGLDGRACMDPDGPHHFGTREQEMERGW